MTENEPGESLIDAVGGQEGIDRLVGALYFQVLNDPRVSRFFDDAPIERILAHQKRFLAVALGGEADYEGRSLAQAHADLVARRGLNTGHFDIVVEHLETTLRELGVPEPVTQQVVERVAATRTDLFATAQHPAASISRRRKSPDEHGG